MGTKICLTCGKEFKTYDKRRKYCSPSCASKINNVTRNLKGVCKFCGKKFEYGGHLYCNKTCRRKAKYYRFQIQQTLRARLNNVINGNAKYRKMEKTFDLIGCSPNFLKQYLESLFKDGMSWDNYGRYGWHIDHIIPISRFDLTKELNMKWAFNWKNLQPLWAIENLEKWNHV